MIHLIAMQVRPAPTARMSYAFAEHRDDRVKVSTVQIAIGVRSSDQREQIVFREFLAG